jgi:NAD(P)-dependent dehydrogenase (short-subunit alcohol dehydrogenase family)
MSGALLGRRALVTGASRGIGAAVARSLAAAGAEVGLVARDAVRLESVASELRSRGSACTVIQADLSTSAGARSVATAAMSDGRPWHILVNNAGVAHQTPLLDETEQSWDALLAVNLRTPMLLAQAMVPGMIAAGGGKIVNVSSVAAFLGTPGFGAYAASKAGLCQLTRTMAVEWGPHNIQVNAVCPTIILTDMAHDLWDRPEMAQARQGKEARIPMHRFGAPEEVAEVVLFLCGPGSNYVNGVSLPVDGGLMASP